MREKDDLDVLLDSALSTYADPGQDSRLDSGLDSGLAQRILARIAAVRESAERTPATRRRWLPWAIALPAAACVLLFIVLGPKIVQQPSSRTTAVAHSPEQSAALSAPTTAARPEPVHRTRRPTSKAQSVPLHRAAPPTPLPKLDIFPTPQPLTPEERALVIVATQIPESQRQALVEAQRQGDEPLSVAAIHIPPLELPEVGKK